MKNIHKNFSVKIAVTLFVIFTVVFIYAYPSGRVGCTKKNSTTGCYCHTNNTSITGSVTGPDTVNAGSTTTYTITVTRSGSTAKAGCNIAVRLGTLTPGTGMRLESGELTHSSGWTLSSGTVSRTFTYTAPASPGIDTIWSTVAAGYSNGFNWSPEKRVVVRNPVGVKEPVNASDFKLNQNYPNPFNPVTTISFALPKSSFVKLTIFDMTGKEVEKLFEGNMTEGFHELNWNASSVPSGIYMYRLESDGVSSTRKMSVIK